MSDTHWNVDVAVTEDGRETRCRARLSGREGTAMIGEGVARANPADENVAAIGDELAAARALSDLSHQLLNTAARDIESRTHTPVQGLRA
ncbi:DUF1876 domain-containing protein [Streptomyces sp. TR06-5]|uniref:DUF1876 domain-containing protein n=1 Tax=unclassified Streptomyces TaxID=2593676 RepID=UPI0039A19E73